MRDELLTEILDNPNYQLLKRVPMALNKIASSNEHCFTATIVDLETMGLNAAQDEIIEIGLISFSFSNDNGITSIIETYNELQDPGKPIPAEVQKITGITDDDVRGKSIDWSFVLNIFNTSHLIICHNSRFDRNFLELQTPNDIQEKIKNTPFACTVKDIDWKERGFESSKLDYLNWKLGYFYDGHRAINDCWATLNLLIQEDGAFDELKRSVRKKETLLCAINAPFDKKDLLKERQYRWSDGSSNLPKCWWRAIDSNLLNEEKIWLDASIYGREGASETVPQRQITARTRYSLRAETLD